jgi:hypothetical protein
VVTKEERVTENQNPANVDSDQVATQGITPAGQQALDANAGTPLYDGLQEPKAPEDDEEAQPVASHNVFEQNAANAGESNTDNVYPVDGDDQASIDAAVRKHHETHGA